MATKRNKRRKKKERAQMQVVDFDEALNHANENDRFIFFAHELEIASGRNEPGPVARIILSKLIALDCSQALGSDTETVKITITVLPKSMKDDLGMVSTEGEFSVADIDGEKLAGTALATERAVLDGITRASEYFTPDKVLLEWDEIPA